MFLTSAELWCWRRGSLACSLQLFKIQYVQFIDPVSFEHILEALFGILKLPDLLSMSFYTVHGSELNADKTRHMCRQIIVWRHGWGLGRNTKKKLSYESCQIFRSVRRPWNPEIRLTQSSYEWTIVDVSSLLIRMCKSEDVFSTTVVVTNYRSSWCKRRESVLVVCDACLMNLLSVFFDNDNKWQQMQRQALQERRIIFRRRRRTRTRNGRNRWRKVLQFHCK